MSEKIFTMVTTQKMSSEEITDFIFARTQKWARKNNYAEGTQKEPSVPPSETARDIADVIDKNGAALDRNSKIALAEKIGEIIKEKIPIKEKRGKYNLILENGIMIVQVAHKNPHTHVLSEPFLVIDKENCTARSINGTHQNISINHMRIRPATRDEVESFFIKSAANHSMLASEVKIIRINL